MTNVNSGLVRACAAGGTASLTMRFDPMPYSGQQCPTTCNHRLWPSPSSAVVGFDRPPHSPFLTPILNRLTARLLAPQQLPDLTLNLLLIWLLLGPVRAITETHQSLFEAIFKTILHLLLLSRGVRGHGKQ